MATFTHRKSGWYAQVRRKGHKTIGRTFNTKAEAEKWALSIESSMGIGIYIDNRESLSTTLDECLTRYSSEILPHKKGANREKYRIDLLKSSFLSHKGIGKIKQVDVAQFRDDRINDGKSPSTVTKDLALLSHVFTIAIKEWGMPLANPVLMIRKPKTDNARNRRLMFGEEEKILELCSTEMRSFVILAIESAMRRSEIVGLMRYDIKGRVAYLSDTKNGTARSVPLSRRALQSINELPTNITGKLFTHKADYYTKQFVKICKKADIGDLRLHDLRHEATSRLFEKGLDIIEAKAITGHKSIQMLSRYTHLNADSLADKLG